MKRCIALLWITPYLLDVAIAMADGSYYRDEQGSHAPPGALVHLDPAFME